MIKIFLLLIISFQVAIPSEEEELSLERNCLKKKSIKKNEILKLIFPGSGTYYVTILSSNNKKINITNPTTFNLIDLKNNYTDLITFKLDLNVENPEPIELTVQEDADIEVTCVAKSDYTEYEKIDYNIDQEIPVKKNNFVIFLTDSDEDYEKFDMKFNFKDDIKEKTVHYGFICLPTDSLEYIALGKQYSDLKDTKFDESAKEITVDNPYYEKDKDKLKKHFAFIFSIDTETEKIGEYSFTINSEIINAFLIVSIVIALVFAVITFFLIRRKQSSESTTIEGGGENFYQNKAKDEKEEKEEKDEKEESTEN